MSHSWIFILADDLTGALEAGAKFAGRGFKVEVTAQRGIHSRPGCDVLVIDTETRHVAEQEAYRVVKAAAAGAVRFRPSLIYKKTDSTLRGNIAAEFRALQDVFCDRPILYAPAYPDLGRTVERGRLYVGGRLLEDTPFANDPLNAVCSSNITALLEGSSVEVLDGTCNAAIAAAARRIRETAPHVLGAGPAALAAALAETFAANPRELRIPVLSRCLVVNGSLHPVSLEQVSFAREQGYFNEDWVYCDARPEGSGLERARRLGEHVGELLRSSRFDGLIVFGGDAAFGIYDALGISALEPYCELLPGVPLSNGGSWFWITKAGGFGPLDTLGRIRRAVT